MGDADGKEQKEEPKKIVHTYPLVRVSHRIRFISILFFPLLQHSDMPEETKAETMDLVVTACEKFSASNEVESVFPLK